MKQTFLFIGKMTICMTLIFALKATMVESNKIANAEIGGWLGSKAASNAGLGTAGEIIGGYTGGEAGAGVGYVAGQWIGGAIGSLGGPAGTYLGIVVGGGVGSVVGAM